MASDNVGFKCVLTMGSDTVGKAIDVELNASSTPIEKTTRDDAGWKSFYAGLKEWDVSIDQLWVPSDTAMAALRDAYLNGTTLAASFQDANGYGFSGNCLVTGIKLGEALNGACMFPVTIKGDGALSVVTGS